MTRCKFFANPHDSDDMPKYLPVGLTQQCVLNNFNKSPPPHHATQDDVSTPLQQLEVDRVTGHQSIRGRGGVIAVMHQTHWISLSRASWERETDLQLSRQHILLYWSGTPPQHRQTNHLYPQMCIGACTTGAFKGVLVSTFWHPATSACSALAGCAATALYGAPNGLPVWHKGDDGFMVARENQRAYDHRWGTG